MKETMPRNGGFFFFFSFFFGGRGLLSSLFFDFVNSGMLQWVRGIIIDKVKVAGVFHRELGSLSASLVVSLAQAAQGK